jgi:hypothetical protein
MNRLFIGLIGLCVIVACSKKDDDGRSSGGGVAQTDFTPPVITLKGEEYVTLSRNSSFEDPGATAIDNVDGDISNRIQVSGTIDSTKFGLYNLVYTVSDRAGNQAVPVVRNVEVVFGRDDFLGTYDVNPEEGCSPGFQINSPQTLTAGDAADQLVFNDFLPLVGGSVLATVKGFDVTLEPTTLQTFFNISGSGTMNTDGKTLIMNITIENTIPFVGSTETCTVTYLKN